MKMKNILILTIILINSNVYTQSQTEIKLNSMISTEYSFSEKASEVGIRDAFIAFIADDGILFRPDPVNGKQFLLAQQNRPGILSWYPSYAFMASAGDMGLTTGPWEFRQSKDSEPVAFGNFCTVWGLQKNGSWEFLIDYGINNNKPINKIEGLKINKVLLDKKIKADDLEKTDSSNVVIELDHIFNLAIEKDGMKKNYKTVCDENSRLLREGLYPIIGGKKINPFFDTTTVKVKFTTYNGKISLGNDFGFTYGTTEIEDIAAEKNYYMRIWRKENTGWKIAVEVTNIVIK